MASGAIATCGMSVGVEQTSQVCKVVVHAHVQGRRVSVVEKGSACGVGSLLQQALANMTPLRTWQKLRFRAGGLVFGANATFVAVESQLGRGALARHGDLPLRGRCRKGGRDGQVSQQGGLGVSTWLPPPPHGAK